MAIQLAFWDSTAPAAVSEAPAPPPRQAVHRRGRLSPAPTASSPAAVRGEEQASSAGDPIPTPADDRRRLLEQLQQQVQQVQAGHRPSEANGGVISCGSEALDQLLPRGGLVPGSIAEWVASSQGSGAGWLALLAARQALRAAAEGGAGQGTTLVVLDPTGTFYPPAAIAMGIPASCMVLVRPAQRADLLWVADQALRCPAVAAVWAPLGQWLDPRDARRLQLAAEAGQTSAFWVRPAAVAGSPSFTEVRWHVSGLPAARSLRHGWANGVLAKGVRAAAQGAAAAPQPVDAGRLLRVELARCRGGTSGAAVTIRLDSRNGTIGKVEESHVHPTAAVHLAAQLACPKVVRSAKKRSA